MLEEKYKKDVPWMLWHYLIPIATTTTTITITTNYDFN
jgi:hypothetical protein